MRVFCSLRLHRFFQARATASSEAALGCCWLGGTVWVGRTRRKSPDRPSRWRLCVRALAKQCFASKAPSPLGARWRHPWRQRSCQPTPPHLRQFPCNGGFSTPCVDEVYRKTRRGRIRFPAENGSDPNSQRAAVAVAFALALLLSLPAVMATETVRGRAGGLGGGVSRMDAAAKPPGTDSRRPPTSPPARPSPVSLPSPQRGLRPLAGKPQYPAACPSLRLSDAP